MELVLIRGLPGTGKSTLAKSMSATHIHMETDMFFYDEATDSYIYDFSKLKEAHVWCENQTEEHLKAGKSVVVSNTFIKLKEMYNYVKLADKYGAELKVIECTELYGTNKKIPCTTIFKYRSLWEPIIDESSDKAVGE